MYKLLLYVLIIGLCAILTSVQIDEEMSLKTLFLAKHAVNRAAHAAAQQTQISLLAEGKIAIDPDLAAETALLYLQKNLHLDETNRPLPGSFLKEPVDLLEFAVIGEGYTFPYEYENKPYHYHVTLKRPGVVMIVRVAYPGIFNLLGPIQWVVKGTAETVDR
ncbi:MAG TPA: hypothetical protein VF260_05940 [Bacilli bacterium]